MSQDIESYKDYWKAVQRSAVIELEETEKYLEAEEQDLNEHELITSVAEYATEHNNLLMYSPRTVINFCDNGFYGDGFERFLRYREFEDNDPRDMIHAIAQAGYYNDVRDVLENIIDCRNELGSAMKMIEDTLWSKGVEAEYEFVRPLKDDSYTFTFEHLGSGEWQMFDHNGDSFEVISPRVKIEQSDGEIDVQTLKVWLDNFCYRRLHKLDEI